MVMIDLVDEKKSLGFSSVTQVTEALPTRYLPYTRWHVRAGQVPYAAGRLPGLVRPDDMPRTEGKCVEPG
jgi:hypothetical protein